MSTNYKSISIANPDIQNPLAEKLAIAISASGLLILLLSLFGLGSNHPEYWLLISLGSISSGVILYSYFRFYRAPEGVKNNGIWQQSITNKGVIAWGLGVFLTGFYIVLYNFPTLMGLGIDGKSNTGLVHLFDPLSMMIKNQQASQWFVYGTLYTLVIFVFGFRFIWKYRHNKYQILRTISVMFFQTGFAFLLPEILERLNTNSYSLWFDKDLKNMWPLDYDFFFDWHLNNMLDNGRLGLFMLIFGVLMIFLISPLLTYLYGKRWYCSWVCGCGGLAETAGDSFRHLSDKSMKAWKIERWMIHFVLMFSGVMTIAVIYTNLGNDSSRYGFTQDHFTIALLLFFLFLALMVYLFKNKLKQFDQLSVKLTYSISAIFFAVILVNYLAGGSNLFIIDSYSLRSVYGFYIGAIFSGVVGVGFYPLLGSRVWCRFGCPMAAVLGIQQKLFSRFRITVNGGQCISCGNCSSYCEMGIDVKSYAQKGQNIVRSSCVGCGICAEVCPRGVLRLENNDADLFNKTEDIRTTHIN